MISLKPLRFNSALNLFTWLILYYVCPYSNNYIDEQLVESQKLAITGVLRERNLIMESQKLLPAS